MQDREAWPHLRILYAIMDNHAYWKENRVNKFTHDQLAQECFVRRQQIIKSLKYLRKRHFLVSIGPSEYINPLYCYKCSPEVLKDLVNQIVDPNKLYYGSELITKPSYWPRFNFRKIKPATKKDDPDGQSKKGVQVKREWTPPSIPLSEDGSNIQEDKLPW